MTGILVVAAVTLGISFLCSLLEAALYSVTPAQLEVLKKQRVFGARRFARFREDVEEPIAAILTVNTLSHTVGSSVLGFMVGEHYGGDESVKQTAIAVFGAVFSFLVLSVTEIVPKSVGVRYAGYLVPYLVWPLQILIIASWPIARPSKWVMTRLTGSGTIHGPTEDEIIALSRMAHRGGSVTVREMRWVENALGLDKVSAHDLMTPRTVVRSVSAAWTVAEFIQAATEWRHSRFPVFEGDDPDRLIGMVLLRDAYDALSRGTGDALVGDLVHPLDMVPEGMKGPELIEKFIRGKRHMVAVIDEYGGFEGIVTLEDVLECLIGDEIVDEHDEHVDMQELARRLARRRRSASGEGAQAPERATGAAQRDVS